MNPCETDSLFITAVIRMALLMPAMITWLQNLAAAHPQAPPPFYRISHELVTKLFFCLRWQSLLRHVHVFVCVFMRGFVFSWQSVWFIMLRGVVEVPEVCRRGLNEWVALTGCQMMEALIQRLWQSTGRRQTQKPLAFDSLQPLSPSSCGSGIITYGYCWRKQTSSLTAMSQWRGGSVIHH